MRSVVDVAFDCLKCSTGHPNCQQQRKSVSQESELRATFRPFRKSADSRHFRRNHGNIRCHGDLASRHQYSPAGVSTAKESPLFAQAEKAYDTATAIVPRIFGMSEGDRLHLESRLKELRVRLEQVATFARVCMAPVAS
jgi:hypothetical protein